MKKIEKMNKQFYRVFHNAILAYKNNIIGIEIKI